MAILLITRAALGVAALFGGSLVLKQAKETVAVVPKTVDSLKSFLIPVTIISAVFLIKALKGR